ncbi:uncharacterized protein LOC117822927 [Notolabrus celidotus]|uniref:uncharacterized protein LOC117822927 n=1 Tax=Notolabrus celidotus TaxID=1203425 RepID=UPI00148F8AC6|nr:uncharacterized protein LOC117822927 [Notolabrus celidotus]
MTMERGRQKLHNVLDDGLGKDLMDAGRFCFSCEQIFADRRCVEEHMCSAASHICSCGTEFARYSDMLEHSTTHEPGHQVLDHETIKKRRVEKRIAEEAQLKRLETGEVVWKAPKLGNVASMSLPVKHMRQVPNASAHMSLQPAQISQVPGLYPTLSQPSLLQNSLNSATDMKNIFAGVGAPTVDLWTLYQPVVMLQTVRKFSKNKPYSCSKCGQCFITKKSLISHHSAHVVDKVSGCIGCGLLLSSRKIVPRFHVCNAPNSSTKFKLITARPVGFKPLNEAGPSKSQSSPGPQVSPYLEYGRQNPHAAINGIQATHGTSALQLKHLNIGTSSQSNQGLHVSPSMHCKRQNPNPAKPFISHPSKFHRPNPNKSGRGHPMLLSGQLKRPTTFISVVPGKHMQTSSRPNGFTCRVCLIPFESAQMLQRHKCIKAQEFMAQRGSSKNNKVTRVTPMAGQLPAQVNGERKLGAPSDIKITQVMAVDVEQGQGIAPVEEDTEMDMDDDCYIIENGPDKSAEMIYQVTSSVPIKT